VFIYIPIRDPQSLVALYLQHVVHMSLQYGHFWPLWDSASDQIWRQLSKFGANKFWRT